MQNRIKIVVLVFSFIISLNTTAQQVPHYTQYMYNQVVLNPAYAGQRADLSIGLLGRTQWVGIDGAPQTQTLSINARILPGLGGGLSVIHDKLGLAEHSSVFVDLAYAIPTTQTGVFSFGLKGGFSLINNNLEQGVTPDEEVYSSIKRTYPNMGIGAYYQSDKLFAGISIPRLLETPEFAVEQEAFKFTINRNMNVFGTFGMLFDVNSSLQFKPSILLKYAYGLPPSIDVNTNFLYKEKFEFGVSYRYHDSIQGVIAFLPKKNMRIGYAYDHTLTNLAIGNLSTHEVILLFDLDFKKNKRWMSRDKCYF